MKVAVDEEAGMSGAKQYTKDNKGKVDYYIALDGGYEGFTYAGIGINWYRHHFIGPGGHTRSRTPPYSATLPLARVLTNADSVVIHSDELLVSAKPVLTNLAQITANLSGPKGSLGEWLLPSNINAKLDGNRFWLGTGGELTNSDTKLREFLNRPDSKEKEPSVP